MVDQNDFELTVDKTPMLPEEDWVELQLVKIVRKKGKYGPKLIFDFKVLDPKYDGLIVQGQQSMKIRSNPNTKANRWYAALSNKKLTEAVTVNVQECVGCYYKGFIENRSGESRIFQNVTRIKFVKEGQVDPNDQIEELEEDTESKGIKNGVEIDESSAVAKKTKSKDSELTEGADASSDFDDNDIPW